MTFAAGQKVTAVSLNTGVVSAYSATASIALTNPGSTPLALTGGSVNVVVTGSNATVQIITTFDMAATSATTMVGHLHWNGVDQLAQAIFVSTATGQRATVGQSYAFTGLTAGTYVAALFAGSSGNGTINATHTGMNILLVDR